MVMLLTVSRIPLLISGLQHWVIRVNGLPFSPKNKTKQNNSSPRGNNPRQVQVGGNGKWREGGGGVIRVNRRWEDYKRRERKGREVGVLKR